MEPPYSCKYYRSVYFRKSRKVIMFNAVGPKHRDLFPGSVSARSYLKLTNANYFFLGKTIHYTMDSIYMTKQIFFCWDYSKRFRFDMSWFFMLFQISLPYITQFKIAPHKQISIVKINEAQADFFLLRLFIMWQ
jgi:hypothetical protein